MYKSSDKKKMVLRELARKTANKVGGFSDRDPDNAYGYGIPNVNALVDKLLNPRHN
jgi:hypothetical protein